MSSDDAEAQVESQAETPGEFRTVYVDPGEDTGWCIARGSKLLAAGTDKLWPFADSLWAALAAPDNPDLTLNSESVTRDRVSPEENRGRIGRIVCEDFRIYPWKAQDLAWDEVRTARLIGALTFMARVFEIPFVLQPAAIKETAVAGGAEEFFYRPLRENRHQNDAIMHFVFFQSFPEGSS